ncbi:hypothetical protein [Arachnia propionica]|uniref:Uncharacterized protein n=1 Tax=Arachnia propionica TaxID=1750 RepID=A0A3P1WYT4_9ACTN|nr:hypothetical protein [Arachnia propionica]RRD50570.1 hypothetical protein EII35_04025 [Arachnia propionica]
MTKQRRFQHNELRTWGYQRFTGQERLRIAAKAAEDSSGTGPYHQSAQVARKCLAALPFPSDYFPLRMLCGLEELVEEVVTRADEGSEGSGGASADVQSRPSQSRKPFLVLTARKMVCLYQVLVEAGVDLSQYFNVLSDRFIFLEPNLKTLHTLFSKKKPGKVPSSTKLYLLDDLSRRGQQLNRRAENFRCHLGWNDLESHEKEFSTRALVNLQENSLDAEHFVRVGGDDGVGMIRAYSRVFARALIPYFTDFPISQSLRLNREQYAKLCDWMSLWDVFEVTSSVAIDERVRTYTLDACPILDEYQGSEGKLRAGSFREWCDIVKLRVFVQSPISPDGDYRVRLMVKPMLKGIRAKQIAKLKQIWVGSNEMEVGLLPEQCTYHQMGQLFGYLEYMYSWSLLGQIWRGIRRDTGISPRTDEIVDTKFASLVLGKGLYAVRRKSLKCLNKWLEEVYSNDDSEEGGKNEESGQ